MGYQVWLYNMIDGGWEFMGVVERSRMEFNMAFRWAWNDSDKQASNGDGECVYINWGNHDGKDI